MSTPQTCVICLTARETGDEEYVTCASGAHALCRECFGAHVRTESGKDVSQLSARGGDVLCPLASDACGAHKCASKPFNARIIAAVCDDETFSAYDAARTRVAEKKIVEEAEARVARAKATAAAAAGEEARLRSTRDHVIENILNVSCTRCGQTFCDFAGCFALKCSRCSAAICGYCTADIGADAHAHIAHCPLAREVLSWQSKKKDGKAKAKKRREVNGNLPDGTFGDMELFEEAQRRRRLRVLAAYSESWDGKFYDAVMSSLEKELKDLKLSRKDVDKARAQKKNPKNPAKQAQPRAAAAAAQPPRGGNARGGRAPRVNPVIDMARQLGELARRERNVRLVEEQARRRQAEERLVMMRQLVHAQQQREAEREAQRQNAEFQEAMHMFLGYPEKPPDAKAERDRRNNAITEQRELEIAIRRSMEDAKRARLRENTPRRVAQATDQSAGPSRKREPSARGNQRRVKVEQTASASRDSKRKRREASKSAVIDLT